MGSARIACSSCEVLETAEEGTPCWNCGGPTITNYRNPASSAWLHPMLQHVTVTYQEPR